MQSEEMLATVRRNLTANLAQRVRRGRRFEIHLVDPACVPDKPEPSWFENFYESSLRPLLGNVPECQLFLPAACAAAMEADESAKPVSAPACLEAYLDWWASRAPFQATYVANVRRMWERAGARPLDWLSQYARCADGRLVVSIGSEVLANALFWWWVCCARSGLRLLVVGAVRSDAGQEFFSRAFDPFYLGGSFEKNAANALAFARAETARNQAIALIVHPNDLYASVVARAAGIGDLFEQAVTATVITKRLWARR